MRAAIVQCFRGLTTALQSRREVMGIWLLRMGLNGGVLSRWGFVRLSYSECWRDIGGLNSCDGSNTGPGAFHHLTIRINMERSVDKSIKFLPDQNSMLILRDFRTHACFSPPYTFTLSSFWQAWATVFRCRSHGQLLLNHRLVNREGVIWH
jgi:hypothetical protein